MVQIIRIRISRSSTPEQYVQGDLRPADGVDIRQAVNQLQALASDAQRHRGTSIIIGTEEVPTPPTPEQLLFIERMNAEPTFTLPTQEELTVLTQLREGSVKLTQVKAKTQKKLDKVPKEPKAKAPKKASKKKPAETDATVD